MFKSSEYLLISCDKLRSRVKTLFRLAGAWFLAGIWLVLGTKAIHLPFCVTHSHPHIGVCGKARRSECYPNRTIGRPSSRTCIWILWSLFRAHRSLHCRDRVRVMSIWRIPAPQVWILTRQLERQYNLSYRRNKALCTWSTSSMLA